MSRDNDRRDFEAIQARGRTIYYKHLWQKADGKTLDELTLEQAEWQAAKELGLAYRYLAVKTSRPPSRKPRHPGSGMARSRRGISG